MSLPLDDQRVLISDGRPQRPTFRLSKHETDHVATLLKTNEPVTYPHPCSKPVADGLVRLFDRGLIDVQTLPERPGRLHVQWRNPTAEATAARHLLRYFGHGSFARNTILGRLTQGTALQFTHTELAVILAWHYRFSGIHALTFDTSGYSLTVTEHHWNGTRTTQTCMLNPPDAKAITSTGDDEYSDKGDIFDEYTYRVFLTLFARALKSQHGAGATTVNLDTLMSFSDTASPSAFTDSLPAITQDALAYLQAPAFTDVDDFIGWSEKSLVLTVPCSKTRHRIQVDPHSHESAPFPATAKTHARHAGEHLLTAFSDDTDTGCAQAQWWLSLFGAESQYDKEWPEQVVAMLTAIRVVARTVQYLDAGVDLAGAAQILRLGLRADQAAAILRAQVVDPAAARVLMIAWAKYHWNAGPDSVNTALGRESLLRL